MTTAREDAYRETLAALAGPVPAGAGFSEEEIAEGERRLGVRLPAALREYYLLAGRLDGINEAHDRLMPPEEWEVNAGKLAFLEENQYVVYWGVDAAAEPDDDPPVFQGMNEDGDPIDWEPLHDRLSEFLVAWLHWQAVNSWAHTGMADVPPEALARLDAAWPLAGRMGEQRAYRKGGLLAYAVPDEIGPAQLLASARTQEEYANLEKDLSRLGIDLDPVG